MLSAFRVLFSYFKFVVVSTGILLFVASSCNQNNEVIQREEQRQIKTEKVEQLAAKYGALSDWNKFEYNYS